MTRLILALFVLAIGIAMLAPFVAIGVLCGVLNVALERGCAIACRGIRHLAAIVEGDKP